MIAESGGLFGELSPGLIIILGALLVPFLPGRARIFWMLVLPVLAFLQIFALEPGAWGALTVLDVPLSTLRVDGLSKPFGYIFSIILFISIIYQMSDGDRLQQTAGLVYAGSAIGAVFAGDLVTLFLFWEGTSIASVFLIWARGTERAHGAGLRYLLMQISSGLLLLAGTIIHYGKTGSLAFESFDFTTTAGIVIFLAFGIKAAFPLLHSWLQDSYPEATISGTVILSAFTTKLAIYALARGFAGTEILIPIGAIMAVFPVFYAVIESDFRRVLAWLLNSQLGFMVVGIGIGTELSVNGAVAHALASVIYQALLFMGIGAVMFRTGTAQGASLGGLARSMPWTAAFYAVAALSIAALPLTAGFVSKSMIQSEAAAAGLFWPWAALLFASVGAFLAAGLKIPVFAFFGHDSGLRVPEAPAPMLVAMGISAVLCIAIGVFPGVLYAELPFDAAYQPYTLEHIVTQLQLLFLTALAFALLLRFGLYPREIRSTSLDIDWLWRGPGMAVLRGLGAAALSGWAAMDASIRGGTSQIIRVLSMHHNPQGVLARTRPSGSMALWMTVMLLAFLIFSFI